MIDRRETWLFRFALPGGKTLDPPLPRLVGRVLMRLPGRAGVKYKITWTKQV